MMGENESQCSEELSSHTPTPPFCPSSPLYPTASSSKGSHRRLIDYQSTSAARQLPPQSPHTSSCPHHGCSMRHHTLERGYPGSARGSRKSWPRYDEATGTVTGMEETVEGLRALNARDMHVLHAHLPALRRRDAKTGPLRQHYYPEGGWGWLVCACAFLAHVLTTGLQLAFGALHVEAVRHFGPSYAMHAAWLGPLCFATSLLVAPLVVAFCRRKSTRLTAVFGGLVLALACLFTSFAQELHQIFLSYGLLLGAGAGMVRQTSSLMVGQYFRRRREFVEIVVQTGVGVGVTLFSVFHQGAIRKLGWRLGLQAVTGVLCLPAFLGALYRSASLYHPQRAAILHLKQQKRRVRDRRHPDDKPPYFDLAPLRNKALQVLVLVTAVASFGLYTPLFLLMVQGFQEGLEDSSLVLLQTFLGFATALGCAGFGLVVVKPSPQCLIARQYLCQAALAGIGLSILALSTVKGYHGYVLFVWLYGLFLGGYLYAFKMLTYEQVRVRHFARAWSFVEASSSVPLLLGVPIAGYINEGTSRGGYYLALVFTLLASLLLFLLGGTSRRSSSEGAGGSRPGQFLPDAGVLCSTVDARLPLPLMIPRSGSSTAPLCACISEDDAFGAVGVPTVSSMGEPGPSGLTCPGPSTSAAVSVASAPPTPGTPGGRRSRAGSSAHSGLDRDRGGSFRSYTEVPSTSAIHPQPINFANLPKSYSYGAALDTAALLPACTDDPWTALAPSNCPLCLRWEQIQQEQQQQQCHCSLTPASQQPIQPRFRMVPSQQQPVCPCYHHFHHPVVPAGNPTRRPLGHTISVSFSEPEDLARVGSGSGGHHQHHRGGYGMRYRAEDALAVGIENLPCPPPPALRRQHTWHRTRPARNVTVIEEITTSV